MAHHNSTPASVLEAPSRTLWQASPQGGTRLERRKGVAPPAALDEKNLARYLRSLRQPNRPFVSPLGRRGKKVRRNRIGGAK